MSTTTVPNLDALTWRKEVNEVEYEVNTIRAQLQLDFINTAFSTDDMPWAKSVPEEQLIKTLDHSLTLGLYVEVPNAQEKSIDEPSSPRTPSPTLEGRDDATKKQIGMARLITDHVTFAYLTDVYIAPEYRRFGLARWLMACTNEVIEKHPAIRRAFCVTGLAYGETFYKETMGFHNVAEEAPQLIGLTRRFNTH